MQAVKRIVPTLLGVAIATVVLFTLFSNHESDYGRVPLPPGGTVELPEGTVKIFFEEAGSASDSRLAAPLSFQVSPSGGGGPLALEPTSKSGTSETQVQRSEDVTSLGAVAKLNVPEEGTYVVRGGSPALAGSALSFGTDPLTAVGRRWQLLAILLGAGVLIALIPLPRGGSGAAAESTGWSSDPRSPYAS
jgi:hypothetical protein